MDVTLVALMAGGVTLAALMADGFDERWHFDGRRRDAGRFDGGRQL